MRHLYLQILLALLAVIVVFTVGVGMLWWHERRASQTDPGFQGLAELVAERIPSAAGRESWVDELERMANRLNLDLSLYDASRQLIWSGSRVLPPPPAERTDSGWFRPPRSGPAIALHLPDGRWLVGQRPHLHDGRWAWSLLLLLGLMSLAAYPIARRLTRRLEVLRHAVDAFGAGDLKIRVPVRGNDEIAAVARGFNTAAGRIEELVAAQRRTLSGASHELRTPLTRLRMAVELEAQRMPAESRTAMEADIEELDALVGELLLASRLQTSESPQRRESVDLLGLAAEECARVEADLDGHPVVVQGDPRLLRRMLRNLLENARRYGDDGAIDVEVQPLDSGARIRVCDRGPGVDDDELDCLYEPFYRSRRVREGGPGGVGLGLALVREIAQLHGGRTSCRRRDGGGLCFEIELGLPGADRADPT